MSGPHLTVQPFPPTDHHDPIVFPAPSPIVLPEPQALEPETPLSPIPPASPVSTPTATQARGMFERVCCALQGDRAEALQLFDEICSCLMGAFPFLAELREQFFAPEPEPDGPQAPQALTIDPYASPVIDPFRIIESTGDKVARSWLPSDRNRIGDGEWMEAFQQRLQSSGGRTEAIEQVESRVNLAPNSLTQDDISLLQFILTTNGAPSPLVNRLRDALQRRADEELRHRVA